MKTYARTYWFTWGFLVLAAALTVAALALLIAALSVPLGPALSRRLTPDLVLPLLGIAASVLIGFRFSQAYARWWEARTLWGQLRNAGLAWKTALLALAVEPLQPLLERMPGAGLAWLVAGGVAYTLGAAVFLLDNRVRYAHAVWHLFVLAGSVCHFFAALWYAI